MERGGIDVLFFFFDAFAFEGGVAVAWSSDGGPLALPERWSGVAGPESAPFLRSRGYMCLPRSVGAANAPPFACNVPRACPAGGPEPHAGRQV